MHCNASRKNFFLPGGFCLNILTLTKLELNFYVQTGKIITNVTIRKKKKVSNFGWARSISIELKIGSICVDIVGDGVYPPHGACTHPACTTTKCI